MTHCSALATRQSSQDKKDDTPRSLPFLGCTFLCKLGSPLAFFILFLFFFVCPFWLLFLVRVRVVFLISRLVGACLPPRQHAVAC